MFVHCFVLIWHCCSFSSTFLKKLSWHKYFANSHLFLPKKILKSQKIRVCFPFVDTRRLVTTFVFQPQQILWFVTNFHTKCDMTFRVSIKSGYFEFELKSIQISRKGIKQKEREIPGIAKKKSKKQNIFIIITNETMQTIFVCVCWV